MCVCVVEGDCRPAVRVCLHMLHILWDCVFGIACIAHVETWKEAIS